MMLERAVRIYRISAQAALIILLILPIKVAFGQAGGPSRVDDCQPCRIKIATDLPEYSFVFEVRGKSASRRVIESIGVYSGDDPKPAQTLTIHDMAPMLSKEGFVFGGVDLNFDGYLDLMLVTARGQANASANYWLFVPSSKTFKFIGTYPIFKVDAERHRLSTYEVGGHGGLDYDAREYTFLDGALTLMRLEVQRPTANPEVFSKIIKERVDGMMKVVRRERVTRAESSDGH
jgi:hypothetical protein